MSHIPHCWKSHVAAHMSIVMKKEVPFSQKQCLLLSWHFEGGKENDYKLIFIYIYIYLQIYIYNYTFYTFLYTFIQTYYIQIYLFILMSRLCMAFSKFILVLKTVCRYLYSLTSDDFVCFDALRPSQQFSVMSGQFTVFLD